MSDISREIGTYTLKFPLKFGSDFITEVTVNRPSGKVMRAMGKGENGLDTMLLMIGALTGLTPKQVDDLDAEDISAIRALADEHVGKSLQIGETS